MELTLFGRVLYAVLGDDGRFPNSRLPVVVCPGALEDPRGDLAERFERLFGENLWPAVWRDGVYPFHHYHARAHESLGICSGSILVQLGGDKGIAVKAGAGDCLVIPAGVAHKRLESSADLLIVGAYPRGQAPDMLSGRPGERPAADRRIAAVPIPARDPVNGPDGPLLVLWQSHGSPTGE